MSEHQATLIDAMGVDNVAFLIENMGADASDLQYLRELVQNAFESIQRADRGAEGHIAIDYREVKGVRKLRITDNGVGMTAEEVAQNINRLSSSGGTQAFDQNFGIGAKITAATQNPNGIIYEAWKNGEGTSTILGKSDGRYGRMGTVDKIGKVHYSLPLPQDARVDPIVADGVSVVLLGKSVDHDTSIAPDGAELPSQWVAAYLERRYFQIPDGITLKVERPNSVRDSGRGETRTMNDTIRGQRYYLDKHSDASGVVHLNAAHADVRWWLLSEDITHGGKTWNNRGHVAALYQDELYDTRTGNAGRSALKDFGIYAGNHRVVIYVEPTNVFKANTARTSLILDADSPLDYSEIGAEFAEVMPGDLAAFMAGQIVVDGTDYMKAIRESLRRIDRDLRSIRYKKDQKGAEGVFEPEAGVEPGGSLSAGEDDSQMNGSGDTTGRVDSEYLQEALEEQGRRDKASPTDRDQIPEVKWVDDNSSVAAGRAATYLVNSHLVIATTTFKFYQDVVAWAMTEARNRTASSTDDDTLTTVCEPEVRRWFSQAFVETVVSLRPMSHDKQWGPSVYETGLSDEGLTAAVLSHRGHLMESIRRGLALRLGKTKP